jgi:hypothetical protein
MSPMEDDVPPEHPSSATLSEAAVSEAAVSEYINERTERDIRTSEGRRPSKQKARRKFRERCGTHQGGRGAAFGVGLQV